MTINQRFPANLISSAKLDAQLVPGLNASGTGAQIVNAGLSEIAEAIQISVHRAAAVSADHARPSMLASLSSFAKNVGDALKAVAPGAVAPFSSLDPVAHQDFAEWQGMIAAVALSNVYSGAGLNLSVSPVALIEAGNVVHKCVLLEMLKDGVYGDSVTTAIGDTMQGCLYYICQDGKPFAVFHPQIGLCAMKNYDPSIFEGILPWYENKGDCHGNWKMVIDPDTTTSLLDNFCLRRIQWWANQNGMLNYAVFVGSHLSPVGAKVVLDGKLKSASLMANAVNIDSTWPGKGTAFGTSMAFYTDGAGKAQGLPKLFNDNMLLTSMATASSNHLIYNTPDGEKPICFSNHPTELQNIAPVAPFRSEFVDLLEACKLEDLDFQAEVLGGKLCGVTVQASIRNSHGEVFHIGKRYDSEHLKLGKLPYMMIWPYIPLPKGMNLWKDFYATWHDQISSISMVEKPAVNTPPDDKFLPPVSDLTFDFGIQGTTHSICRVTAETKPWTVCKSASPFRYAMVKEMVDGIPQTSWGLIFLPEYEFYNPGAMGIGVLHASGGPTAIQLAVDFGTTSTVCALKTTLLNHGQVTPLPYRDYSRTVTCSEDDAKKIVDEQHWLGKGNTGKALNWDQKIFSVAQLFGKGGGFALGGVVNAGNQEYYIDGRMFLISGEAMVNYASAGNTADDPLLTQQIMSDMKFNDTLNVQNTLAASVYLAGVYMHAVLYLLSQKVIPVQDVDYLELRASYPNDVTLGALKQNWNNAYGILSTMMDPALIVPIQGLLNGHADPKGNPVSQFFSEATATTAYLHGAMAPIGVKAAKNLVSLDIGGGTTDISITSVNYHNTVRKLSFRYAGREIVVASLIEFFRKFHDNTVIGTREDAFQQIWPNSGNTIMNQFLELTQFDDGSATPFALQNLTDNSSIQMDIELLLSEGMDLGKVPIQMQNNLLRQLMALKFLMVMRIVARMIKEHLDIWINPLTGQLDTTNGILEIDLSVSGTSAQVLQYIFDSNLTGLQALADAPAGQMLQLKQLLEAMLDEELDGKVPNGVKTNLRIYVNPNVKEKREVCFGMLDPEIYDYVITPAGKKFKLGAMALDTTLAEADRKAKVADTKVMLRNYRQNELDEYLRGKTNANGIREHGLLDFARAYENIFFAHAPKGNLPISGINTISELLVNYTGALGAAQMNVANKKAVYMVEPEQEPYRDLLACTYLVEEILNSEIAKRQ